jgi:hypothetical protein
MTFRLMSALVFGVAVGSSAFCAAQSSSDCKPVERYGVKGCERLPDGSCPAGYHAQAVNPPDPRMAAPTFLMCVPDKSEQKKEKPKQQKPDSQQKPGSPTDSRP